MIPPQINYSDTSHAQMNMALSLIWNATFHKIAVSLNRGKMIIIHFIWNHNHALSDVQGHYKLLSS
jgi:hypothetical protein